MSTKKKWLDLSSFGAQLVVTPKTDLRNQAAIIKIKDVELLEKKLNTSLNSFLTGLKQTGKFVYITNEQNNDLSFMYKSSQDSLSLADIKSVFPYDSKNDLIEMDMSDIYLQNPMSSAEKNQWQSLFELNNQKSVVLYQAKQQKPFAPNTTIMGAVKQFNKADLGWNKLPTLLQSVDPLPLADLDNYGYQADKTLTRYYVDKEAALNAGLIEDTIEPIELSKQLVISVNSGGEVLALKDITQIPELTNYKISSHPAWPAYNSLPKQFIDIRELNKGLNTSIDPIVNALRSDDHAVNHQGLIKLQTLVTKINDCLYSYEENSIPSALAPFGIETTALQLVDNDWKVWEYNNQTLDVEEFDLTDKIKDLIQSVQNNINNLRTFDPYSIGDSSFDRELIYESLDDIGTSLESLDLNQIKQTIPPEPKVPVKRLFNRIDHFFRHTKFKPNIPEPVIKDSLTKLALMRKIKQEYLQKIAKLKEERQAIVEAKATHTISERIEKAVAIQVAVATENAYVLDQQAYEDQAYEMELALSQLNIASTRLNNLYDSFFDSVIDREEYGTDLDNFLQSVVTDDELQDEMQRLLDEANEFEATHTSNDIDIYHFNVDLGEEPNGLWNEAVNQFDVVHYYDEQDQELSAVEKFEYSILGYSPSQESAMPDFNDMVFSNAVSVLDNSIEDMIATSAENVGKNYFSFHQQMPRILQQLHSINSQFTALGDGDAHSIASQYLSDESLERFYNLLEQDGNYKGFNKRIDVAHVLSELSSNIGNNPDSPILNRLPDIRSQLNHAINEELRVRTNPGNALANAIVFAATNEVLSLKETLEKDEIYVVDSFQNYLPKVIHKDHFNSNTQEQLFALNKKVAVSMAYKRYLQDFYQNAVGEESKSEAVTAIINNEHKHILMALGYLTPTYNEVTAPKDSKIENVVTLTEEAVKTYLAEGNALMVEPEVSARSLAVYSSTIASDQNFIRLLPMDLGQKVSSLQKQKTIMINGASSFEHILSSNPISKNKLTYDDLKNVILNRILTKEAVPKYEKGLKLDIEVKNVYEHASSFLPLEKTDVNSKNDFGNLFKHGLVLEALQSTPDSLKNGFNLNRDLINSALLQSFENRSIEEWTALKNKSLETKTGSLLSIITNPERIKEFEFPEINLYLTVSPADEQKHGAINLYFSGEQIPSTDRLIVKSSLNDLAADDKALFKALTLSNDSVLSTQEQMQYLIDSLEKRYQIFQSIENLHLKEKVLFNPELDDYKALTLRDADNQYIDPTAKQDLIDFVKSNDVMTNVDLMNVFTDYINQKEMDQAFENGSKIIVANDGADLVISVIDKDTPVLQHDQLRVFDNVEQFAKFNERGGLFKDFQLNGIKAHLVDQVLNDLGLRENILQTIKVPLSPGFENIDVKGLNEIVAVNISTLVNKIDFTFGEKLLESKDRFDLAIKVADDQSPLKLAIVNNAEHQQFVDQGYKILPTPKHPNSKNFLITDFAKSFKKAELFKSRDQVYKPEHMVQSAPVVEVAQEPLVEEPIVTEPEVQKPTEPEVQEATVEVVEPTEPVAPEQTSLFESEGKPEAEAPKEPKTTKPKATESRSEVGLIEDTGMKMPGAKKDLYGPRLSLSQIQDMSLLQVKNLITRDKIWKKESVLQAKEAGRDIYIHLLTDAVRKMTNDQPRYPLENATEEQFKKVGAGYYDAVLSMRDALMEAKTVREFIPNACDLYVRLNEDKDLFTAFKSLDRSLFSLVESYAEYAATDMIISSELAKTDSSEARKTLTEALHHLRKELPPVKGTYSIYKKIRSAIDAKPFQDKVKATVTFRSGNIIDSSTLFSRSDAGLSEQVMDLLTAKKTKDATAENDDTQEVSLSEKNVSNIVDDTASTLDALFKEYAKPRTMRKAFKLSDVVVTENIASRNGQDVTAHTLQATFGFKAVEFGEYLNQSDRQIALNNAYDGCFALAKALDIDPKFVGFNGMLGVAFGSRGRSAAMAHYEPSNRVINLTKNSGFGSFGHEFFHAYDHLIFSAMTRNQPKMMMENVQPYLTRFAELNNIKSEKYANINQDLLQAAAKVNQAMYYLPMKKDDSIEVLRTNLENQVKFYETSIKTILDKTLVDQPDIVDLFTPDRDSIKEKINTFIAERGKLHTELSSLINFANRHEDPELFQKDAIQHRRYMHVAQGLHKFLSENEYPIPRTELNKYISQSRSEIDHDRVFAAQVLGAANSTVFRSVVFRDYRQMLRSQFAICALDFIKENSPKPLSDEHLKLISLSLQTNDRLTSTNQSQLKTDFYKNAMVLEGLTSAKKPYWTTAHEMFARSGEQYLQVTLAEMNLRNDWLVYPCPEGGSSSVTQPHGIEKDAIMKEIREFTVKGLDYIQENIAELRFADHQQYVRNAMHFFQPGTDQHENLVKWNEVINEMSQAEYDEYWTKLMTNIEVQADPELSKQKNSDPELAL